jgi:hypothetical protein
MNEFYGEVYGKRLDSPYPQGQLMELDPHTQATPLMLSRARELWRERSIDEFEVVQTGAHKFVFDANNVLHMLRRRGPQAPDTSVPLSGYVRAQEIKGPANDPSRLEIY